jgi:hypothetical protein
MNINIRIHLKETKQDNLWDRKGTGGMAERERERERNICRYICEDDDDDDDDRTMYERSISGVWSVSVPNESSIGSFHICN